VIVVGATGNDSKPRVYYPGKYDSIIAVSATNRNDQLASFSNYGTKVVVAGPGNLITSLIPGGFPATMSGTSFAAPHVTGTLALILSVNPQLTAAQALAMLEGSVTDLGDEGHDRQFGHGLIDAYRGVTWASR
jgi:subtilisin family serine protease